MTQLEPLDAVDTDAVADYQPKLVEAVTATGSAPWLPLQLRIPSASGAKGDTKFAFFAEKRRLLIEHAGALILYDCGDHQVSGIRAPLPMLESLMFSSQNGEQSIHELRRLS